MNRSISWVKQAKKVYAEFPYEVQRQIGRALEVAAEGRKADFAKPLTGFGSGVFEVALGSRGEAYRVVYAVHLGDDVWVVHAFQKKSTQGIKTPKREMDVVRERLKRVKELEA